MYIWKYGVGKMSDGKLSVYPNGIVCMTLSGKVTGEIIDKGFAEISKRGLNHVILNLVECETLKDNALSTIKDHSQAIKDIQGEIVFIEPKKQIKLLLKMMGIDSTHRFYNTVNDALIDANSKKETIYRKVFD